MLVRFSVSTMGGLEIFSYDVEKFKEVATDPMLVSGFMSPIKMDLFDQKVLRTGEIFNLEEKPFFLTTLVFFLCGSIDYSS